MRENDDADLAARKSALLFFPLLLLLTRIPLQTKKPRRAVSCLRNLVKHRLGVAVVFEILLRRDVMLFRAPF